MLNEEGLVLFHREENTETVMKQEPAEHLFNGGLGDAIHALL